MDLLKVVELLGLSNSIINGEGSNATERLALAATLELGCQDHLARRVMQHLSNDLQVDLTPSSYRDDGRFGNGSAILGKSNEKKLYWLAKALGVRLVVTAETIYT